MYEIHQPTIYGHYEVIPDGEFETEAAAIAAANDLQKNLGWTGLKIVPRDESDAV